MRKDILLSLLAVGAVPTAAFADVNLNDLVKSGEDWQIGGLQGIDPELAEKDFTSSVYVGNASTGSLSTTVKALPKGDYSLTFGTLTNASVTIAGAGVVTKTDNVYTFSLAAEGDITITVEGTDKGASYTVGGISFVIKCTDKAKALFEELSGEPVDADGKTIVLAALTEHHDEAIQGNIRHSDKAINDEIARLNAEWDAIAPIIADLEDGDLTLDNYKAMDGLKARVEAYKTAAEASNAAVKQANDDDANYVVNRDARDGELTSSNDLSEEVKAEVAKTNPADPEKPTDDEKWIIAQVTPVVNAFNEAKAAFDELVNKTYGNAEYDKDGVKVKDNAKITEVSEEAVAAIADALEALGEAKEAVADAVAEAKADVEAWHALTDPKTGYKDDLKADYDKAIAYFKSLTGTYTTDYLTKVEEAYKKATDTWAETTQETAHDDNEKNTAAYEEAKENINGWVAEAKENVAKCEEVYAELAEELSACEDAVSEREEAVKEVLTNKAAIDEALEDVKDALNALEAAVDKEKKAYNAEPDLGDLANAYIEALENLDTLLEAAEASDAAYTKNKEAIDGYYETLEAAKQAIEKESKVIADKLNGSYNAIKAAIDAQQAANEKGKLTGKIPVLEDDFIKSGLDTYSTDGLEIAKAYNEKNTAYENLLAANTELANAFNMTKLPGNAYDETAVKGKQAGFATDINKIKDALDAALKLENDALYVAIKAIEITLTEADIEAQRLVYAEGVAKGNLNVLDGKIGEYDTEFNGEDAFITYGPGLKGMKESLAGYKTDYTTLGGNVDTAVAAKDVAEEAVPAVGTPGEEGYVPAKPAVKGAINTANEAVCAKYNTMVADLNAQEVACKANVEAHKDLIVTSEKTSEKVAEVIASIIEDNMEKEVKVTVTIDGKEVETTIGDLLENTLPAYNDVIVDINSDEADEYEANNCAKVKDDLTARYNAVSAEVEAIWNSISGDNYWDAVRQYNDKLITDEWTNGMLKKLNDAYKDAVDTYNRLITVNEDLAYRAVVSETLKDHQDIYPFATLIRELDAAVEALRKSSLYNADGSKSEDPHAISWLGDLRQENGWAQEAYEDMVQYKADIIAAANACAAEYYANAKADVVTYIAEVEQEMKDAEIPADIINNTLLAPNTAVEDADAAKTFYENDLIKDGVKVRGNVLSENMDEVLGKLIKGTNIDTETAAEDYWHREYLPASENAMSLYSQIEADLEVADFSFPIMAGDEVVNMTDELLLEIAGGIVNNIEALDEKDVPAWKQRDMLFNKIKDLVEELKSYIAQLEEIADMAAEARAQYEANAEAREELLGSLGELEELYNDMRDAVGALGLPVDEFAKLNTADVDKKLEDLKSEITDSMLNAADDQKALEAELAELEAAILETAKAAYEAEKEYLAERLHDVEIDFNNAKAAGEDVTEWNEKIDEVLAAIEVLDPESAEDYIEALQTLKEDCEEVLNSVQEEITGEPATGNNDPLNTANANLAEMSAEVAAAIADLQTLLDEAEGLDNEILEGLTGYDKDQFQSMIDALTENLEKVDAKVAGEGNMLVLYIKKYTEQYNNLLGIKATIENKINAKDAAAQAIVDKREASNAKAEELQQQLDNLKTEIAEVEALIASFENVDADYFAQSFERIGLLIDADQTRLNEKKAEYSLGDDAKLLNAEQIETALGKMKADAIKTEIDSLKEQAQEAINEAVDVLEDPYVIVGDIDDKLNDLQEALDDLDTTDYEEAIAEVNRIIKEAKALTVQLDNNRYTPGDLGGDGKVTTADFVALVDIILENADAPEPGTPAFAAADINNDGELGIGDAVALMNIINGKATTPAKQAAPARSAVMNSANLIGGGLNITNNFAVASVLIDLKNVAESDITLSARADGMQMMSSTLADGTVRVMLIGNNGETLAGNEGSVINVAGNAAMAKVVVSNVNGKEAVLVNNSEATGIDAITGAIKNVGEKIYNLGGQMMNGIKKGINILRNTDGSSTKVLKK